MSHKPVRTTGLVLFFDACMPRMDECFSGCKSDEKNLCKHRFNQNVDLIYHTAYMGYLEFSDYQVAKHCFYLINKSDLLKSLSRKKRFFIITKDKRFMQDAEKVYLARKKPNTPALGFDFKLGIISCGPIELVVHTVLSGSGTGGHAEDLSSLIEELNKRFPKL